MAAGFYEAAGWTFALAFWTIVFGWMATGTWGGGAVLFAAVISGLHVVRAMLERAR